MNENSQPQQTNKPIRSIRSIIWCYHERFAIETWSFWFQRFNICFQTNEMFQTFNIWCWISVSFDWSRGNSLSFSNQFLWEKLMMLQSDCQSMYSAIILTFSILVTWSYLRANKTLMKLSIVTQWFRLPTKNMI